MTQKKINDLRQRMIHHAVVNDTAVVVVTAAELDELLNIAEGITKFVRPSGNRSKD